MQGTASKDGENKTKDAGTIIHRLYLLSPLDGDHKKYVVTPLGWIRPDAFVSNAEDQTMFVLKRWTKDLANGKEDSVDLLGWSRGCATVLAILDELKIAFKLLAPYPVFDEYLKKHPFKVRFVGLIDPVSTGITNAPTTVPGFVQTLWLGVRDMKEDGAGEGKLFKLMELKYEKEKETKVLNADHSYPLTHAQMGRDETVMKDLYTAATENGVPFEPLDKK